MDSNSQDVLVVLSAATDLQLVQYLLNDINHRLHVYGSNAASVDHLAHCEVVIICHHGAEHTPLPSLPIGGAVRRVIVLSDCHDENTIVRCLEAGAHHYFDITEARHILAVRLLAAIRSHTQNTVDVLEVLPFKFYVERRKVTHNDEPIHLSPREFALAFFLFSNHGRVVFDSELMVSIWTLPSSMDSRRIDTAVCRIRKKMNLYDDESGWSLHRLRQVGYKLTREVTTQSTNFLPNLSKCLQEAPQTVSVHNQTSSTGSANCTVLSNRSTISAKTASSTMIGGTART